MEEVEGFLSCLRDGKSKSIYENRCALHYIKRKQVLQLVDSYTTRENNNLITKVLEGLSTSKGKLKKVRIINHSLLNSSLIRISFSQLKYTLSQLTTTILDEIFCELLVLERLTFYRTSLNSTKYMKIYKLSTLTHLTLEYCNYNIYYQNILFKAIKYCYLLKHLVCPLFKQQTVMANCCLILKSVNNNNRYCYLYKWIKNVNKECRVRVFMTKPSQPYFRNLITSIAHSQYKGKIKRTPQQPIVSFYARLK